MDHPLVLRNPRLLKAKINGIFKTRGLATGGGVQVAMVPPLQCLNTKQGPTVSVSNIRDISFYGCSEIIQTINFTIFTVNATIFGQYTAAFHNYIGEIDHFTLDLLKRSDTKPWTFWKVWTRVQTLHYRRNPGPTKKVLQNKTSTYISGPLLNIIASILELLKTLSEVIVASKCDLLSRFEKQAMS